MDSKLNSDQIIEIRKSLILFASKLLGVKYEFGAEWLDLSEIPKSVDCSELIEGIYNHYKIRMPDGSQNQYNFTVHSIEPKIGDLVFFGRGGNANKIYHVGMIYDEESVIEARGFDPSANFITGEVILRPIVRWKNYANFIGFRSHPKLVL